MGSPTEVSVRKPSGEWLKLPVTENPLAFRDTSEVGIYTVRVGKKTQRFAVNLVSREESDIIPKPIERKIRRARPRKCIDARRRLSSHYGLILSCWRLV